MVSRDTDTLSTTTINYSFNYFFKLFKFYNAFIKGSCYNCIHSGSLGFQPL